MVLGHYSHVLAPTETENGHSVVCSYSSHSGSGSDSGSGSGRQPEHIQNPVFQRQYWGSTTNPTCTCNIIIHMSSTAMYMYIYTVCCLFIEIPSNLKFQDFPKTIAIYVCTLCIHPHCTLCRSILVLCTPKYMYVHVTLTVLGRAIIAGADTCTTIVYNT